MEMHKREGQALHHVREKLLRSQTIEQRSSTTVTTPSVHGGGLAPSVFPTHSMIHRDAGDPDVGHQRGENEEYNKGQQHRSPEERRRQAGQDPRR